MPKKPAKPSKITRNPDHDAWLTAFFLENHIDPFAYPTKVGTPEQTEFMVYSDEGSIYYPCSDKTFDAIMSRKRPEYLMRAYQQVYNRVISLVDEFIEQEYDRKFLKALIKIKYDHEVESGLIIPSRLEKRLYKIFLSRTHIEDPYSREKQQENRQAARLFNSETFKKALNKIDGALTDIKNLCLEELKEKIKEIELKRLLSLYTRSDLWKEKNMKIPGLREFHNIFNTNIHGEGLQILIELIRERKSKILWLSDDSGSFVVDIRIAKFLANLGHTVIIVVKEGSFYKHVCLRDTRTDPTLINELENVHFIHDKTISKNRLVQCLKQEANIYVVSDGTREDLNLLLASTTFARVFKESDLIVSRGENQKNRLINTNFKFTRDIINISPEAGKGLFIIYKPRHPDFINFSHQDLEEKAGAIIDQMKAAKARNMTVMFYSGIIGSLPGKIDVAKKIMTVFIDHLQSRSSNLFIINPSLYYEPGMDADDLMYMWEIVQRSSYIDIWRFQTADDIEQSFALMDKKIPPEWIGKDATYSTGCTKEMRIARDVLQKNPEMQLIGPDTDKFMRRDEYGVGSMYDRRLAGD